MSRVEVEITPAEPVARPRRTRRRLWLLMPVALLAPAFVAAVLWPRGPELVPYVSPALDARGTRLHVLAPRGCVVRFHPLTQSEDAPPGVTAGMINVTPREPWIPRPLRRWISFTEQDLATMMLAFTRSPHDTDTQDYYETMVGAQDMAGHITARLALGGRQLPDHRTYVTLYYRGSKATLDRTAPAIYRSLRIAR